MASFFYWYVNELMVGYSIQSELFFNCNYSSRKCEFNVQFQKFRRLKSFLVQFHLNISSTASVDNLIVNTDDE